MEMYWPLCPFSISTESGFSRTWAKSASLDAWNWGRKARTLESTGWAGKMGQSHDLLAANRVKQINSPSLSGTTCGRLGKGFKDFMGVLS